MTSVATRWTISICSSSSFWKADERDHDLGLDLDAFLVHLGGGFEDGARLHLGDFGIGDAEPAAADGRASG